jgi:[acyl-carrier-protein] S-malonyltransferase
MSDSNIHSSAQSKKKCVFLYPGQGSQSVGMGKSIMEQFPEIASVFEEASDTLGYNMSRLCFEDPENQLSLTEFTQPALLTVSFAIGSVLQKRGGLLPDFSAGHSLGEYSALTLLNFFSFAEALKAVRFRGMAMQKAVPVGKGAMAAYLGENIFAVEEMCKSVFQSIPHTEGNVCEIVNYNSPTQFVLSGHSAAVKWVSEKISEMKLGKCIPLKVSAPFHSSLMQPAAEEMKNYFNSQSRNTFTHRKPTQEVHSPQCMVANVDATPYSLSENKYFKLYQKNFLVSQVSGAVRWTQSIQKIDQLLTESNCDNAIWIEVGPGSVLQNLNKKIFANRNAELRPIQTFGTHTGGEIAAILETYGG